MFTNNPPVAGDTQTPGHGPTRLEVDVRLNPDRTKTDPWGEKFVYFIREVGDWRPCSEREFIAVREQADADVQG